MSKLSFENVPACYWRDEVKISHVEKRVLAASLLLIEVSDGRHGSMSVESVKALEKDAKECWEQLDEMVQDNWSAAAKSEMWYAFFHWYEGGLEDPRKLIDLLTVKDRTDVTKVASGMRARMQTR